ncbi:hypothetical protein KIN20_007197 [Parelaphostrongylus tenuis]|uniref:Uncharacterized protein n=1 Tax=Parelaphostrongylus tenuis TaxID=148309 RepID=A0AAD5QHM4_PARTN|nr:hypothetical protein KIN20_007197 [Parelaphostrongylus tenuis]
MKPEELLQIPDSEARNIIYAVELIEKEASLELALSVDLTETQLVLQVQLCYPKFSSSFGCSYFNDMS